MTHNLPQSKKNRISVKGVVLLALLVLVESLQLVFIAGYLLQFVPFAADAFNADLFPKYKAQLKQNHQVLIYHIFIMSNILLQSAGVGIFHRKLSDPGFQKEILHLLAVDSLWVLIQGFAVFKILIYGNPAWARYLFYGSLAASVLSRVFWIEISAWCQKAGSGLEAAFRTDLPGLFAIGDASIARLLWGPWLVLVESIQVVIACSWLLGPKGTQRSFVLFGIFVLSTAIGGLALRFLKVRLPRMVPFIVAESLLTFFMLSALFKMVIYDYRGQLAAGAYHVLLVLALLNKLFWPGVWHACKRTFAFFTYGRDNRSMRLLGDGLMAALITAMVAICDPQAVLAKMFVGEQFVHMNAFIMAPGWAYVSGCILNVDVIARYGIGVTVVLSKLAQALGGFNHLNMLLVIEGICIVYYVLCYMFLRTWLKSFLLAAAAILLGIKAQMFYTMSFPQPLTYLGGSPVRFAFDVLFFIFVWGHLRTRRWFYLWLAGASCALAAFYVIETGLYMTVAFYVYLFMNYLVPGLRSDLFASPRRRLAVASCMASIPLGAFFLLALVTGSAIWTGEFWRNNFEFAHYYTGGLISGYFFSGLQYGQFWDLLVALLFPVVYVVTICIIGPLCVLQRISPKHLMVIVLCIYGLCANHYFIVEPIANNYYMRGLPFIFVVFYWIRLGTAGLGKRMRQGIGMALAAFSFYALWTNHHYLSYPNIFNFSRNPMVDPLVSETLPDRRDYLYHRVRDYPEADKLPLNSLGETDEGFKTSGDFASDEELKDYYETESDFSRDARLIQSLTAPRQAVPLISSFEELILQQAGRRPMFYYFSLFFSRPMRMRNFGTMEIFSHGQLAKLTDQLEFAKPPFVFVERILLNRDVPSNYSYENPALMGLLDYVFRHYRPYSYGKYLAALKRI